MIRVHATPGSIIALGRRGENNAREVIFSIADWRKTYGEGIAQLIHQRSGDIQPYPCTVTQTDSTVIWQITAADVATAGYGLAELQYIVGSTLAKSATWATNIASSLSDAGAAPPDPQQSWVEQVLRAGADAQESAEKAEEAAIRQPSVGANGNWLVWDAELEDYVDSGEKAQGPQGPQGVSGVFVGSGDMPAGFNIQIDPNGSPGGWVDTSGKPTDEYTAKEYLDAYLRYAHKKLKNYTINNSKYVDPSGYVKGSYTTPADLFRIGLIVASNSKSYKFWGGREKYATVNIMGKNAREVTFPDLWNGVGGTRFCNKSGGVTYGSERHRAGFQLTTLNNKQAAISIAIVGADYYDYITTYISNIKQMLRDLDEGKTVTEPEGLAEMVAAGGGYVASFLPEDIAKYQQITFSQMISSDGTSGVLKDFMIRNNPNVKRTPASTTKIVTLMCALDALGGSDLDTVEVTEDDITGGSGIALYPGDKLTVGDALFAMMVSSSNTIATTLARYIGYKVLKSEEA